MKKQKTAGAISRSRNKTFEEVEPIVNEPDRIELDDKRPTKSRIIFFRIQHQSMIKVAMKLERNKLAFVSIYIKKKKAT